MRINYPCPETLALARWRGRPTGKIDIRLDDFDNMLRNAQVSMSAGPLLKKNKSLFTHSMAQSIDPSSDNWLPRSIARSHDGSIARSVDRAIARTLDRSMGRSLNRSIVRSLDRSIERSRDRSIARARAPSIADSIARSTIQALEAFGQQKQN